MYYGEKFNSITHLVGSVLSLMGLGALLAVSIQLRDPLLILSFDGDSLRIFGCYSLESMNYVYLYLSLHRNAGIR